MIYINGRFFSQPVTGVQRFAREITSNLTLIRKDICVLIPKGQAQYVPENIPFKEVGILKGSLWEQFDIPFHLRGRDDILINLTNTAPMFYCNNIFTLHDIIFNIYPKSYKLANRFYYKISSYVNLKYSRKILTVSEYSKKSIVEYYDFLERDKIDVIYNSVPNSLINYHSEVDMSSSLKNKLGVNFFKEKKVFSTLSSFDENKNLSVVIDAFLKRNDDTTLLLIGGHVSNSPYMKSLLHVENIAVTGRVSDEELISIYKNSYGFIIPSKLEGFGIPPLEAQSQGCPIISSDRSSLPEVLGDSALYFNPESSLDLSDKINIMINNSEIYNSLKNKAKNNICRFSFFASAEKLSKIIDEILDDGNKKEIKFFLVVSTLGRKKELKLLLESLHKQTYKKFQLHIVDQNRDGLLDELMDEYKHFIDLYHHKVDFKGVSKGRSYALNYLNKSFDVVSFPDDDCIYSYNCLEKVANNFLSNKIHIFSGTNVSLEEYEEFNKVNDTSRELNLFNVWKNGPTYVFFYSNEAVSTVGGYDENLGPSPNAPYLSGEDSDYSIRIIKKYGNGIKDRDLKIAHPKLVVNKDVDYYKCVGYSLGRMKVMEKHSYPFWFILINKLYPMKGVLLNLFDKKMRKYYLLQLVARW
ncbi:glycosyltransferase [Tatumella morbirosei]|uniref:glycosyltransferase n=1 Tax=Tatumella morbirosei TaxID=642227 RepID=UPI0006996AFC|nr:glycosyltransferase [Tatumella morbirosei]